MHLCRKYKVNGGLWVCRARQLQVTTSKGCDPKDLSLSPPSLSLSFSFSTPSLSFFLSNSLSLPPSFSLHPSLALLSPSLRPLFRPPSPPPNLPLVIQFVLGE